MRYRLSGMVDDNQNREPDDFDEYDAMAEAEDRTADDTLAAAERHAEESRQHAIFGVKIILAALALLGIYTQSSLKDLTEKDREKFVPEVKLSRYTAALSVLDKETKLPVEGLIPLGQAAAREGPFEADASGPELSRLGKGGWLVISRYDIRAVFVKIGAPGYHGEVVELSSTSPKIIHMELEKDRTAVGRFSTLK